MKRKYSIISWDTSVSADFDGSIYTRKCPCCGSTIKHKNYLSFNRGWKQNLRCKSCTKLSQWGNGVMVRG
jgi:endogenous inhibitor of DNA gyrase (YacG/DUF329 family)